MARDWIVKFSTSLSEFLVQANRSEWLKRNGLWIAILVFLLLAAIFQWRRIAAPIKRISHT
jgi:hypothetical protein